MRVFQLFLSAVSLIFSGCLFISEAPLPFLPFSNQRRAFVNDPVANDSMNAAVAKGINFFVQPQGNYTLTVSGLVRDNCRIHAYRIQNRYLRNLTTPIAGSWNVQRSSLTFPINVNAVGENSEMLWVIMRTMSGNMCSESVDDVVFSGRGPYPDNAFGINYHFLGSFFSYETPNFQMFTDSLHQLVSGIYRNQAGVHLYQSGPHFTDSDIPYTIFFPSVQENPPELSGGQPSYVNVVFVSTIINEFDDSEILGFAPRESRGMNMDPRNWVIIKLDIYNSKLWTTIAHEVGHFLGLRHTVATQLDVVYDNDLSNHDDGFSDTEFCNVGSVLKRGIHHIADMNHWCVRRASSSNIKAVCSHEAMTNLMFPVEQPNLVQDRISPMQAKFIKKSLSLYKH